MITDYHSHILPGVDDGFRSMEDSLEALSLIEREGVGTLWLTPHIMEDYPNTTEGLRSRYAELKQAYKGGIRLQLAAEYMMDNIFEERLENRDLLPIGVSGDHILVETSCFTPPMDLDGTLRKILSAGYFPLLAHPERYFYMEWGHYKHLLDMGVRFQLNLGSLGGAYGRLPRFRALRLLMQGAYTVAGSDIHSVHMLDIIHKAWFRNRFMPLLDAPL